MEYIIKLVTMIETIRDDHQFKAFIRDATNFIKGIVTTLLVFIVVATLFPHTPDKEVQKSSVKAIFPIEKKVERERIVGKSVGGTTGGAAGLATGIKIGAIGVAACGTAFAVPAVVVVGTLTVVGAGIGYLIGDGVEAVVSD